jgi:hypothetical protein
LEDLYALYLYLFATNRAGDSEAFTATVDAESSAINSTTKRIEVYAAAAIAVSDILLDYYDFQQQWERYHNLSPKAVMQ